MKNIAIFGGGVGGLTAAHYLCKSDLYNVTLYETKNVLGGLARSSRDKDGCATEYCWRVFFGFYHNVFKMMKEIHTVDKNNIPKNKSVHENLTKYVHQNISDQSLSIKDAFTAICATLYGYTSCDERLNDLDKMSWYEALGSNNTHSMGVNHIGEWLGMDRYKGSYKSVIKVGMEMQVLPTITDPRYNNYVTTKPTSEAWFNHWKILLKRKNVQFNFETELESIEMRDNKIISCVVKNNLTNEKCVVIADHFIFALPVEVLSKLINQTPEMNIGELQKIQKLKDNGLHMQLSFQVFFNQKISLGKQTFGKKNHNAFLQIDSKWDLIILQYDQIYKDTYLSRLHNVKGAWSIAVCTAYTNGIVFNKPFNKCTYDEILIEIWAQLKTCRKLLKIVKDNNTFEFSKRLIVKWSPMWETFSYDENDNLVTSEPKFTNNAGTWWLRPSYKTPIDNLYISTAYVKEGIDIFSMEAACIAGKYVANDILKKDGQDKGLIESSKPIIQSRPKLFWIFRVIDGWYYSLCGYLRHLRG